MVGLLPCECTSHGQSAARKRVLRCRHPGLGLPASRSAPLTPSLPRNTRIPGLPEPPLPQLTRLAASFPKRPVLFAFLTFLGRVSPWLSSRNGVLSGIHTFPIICYFYQASCSPGPRFLSKNVETASVSSSISLFIFKFDENNFNYLVK